MKVILSDTSPLHYLALIQELKVLPALFGRIIVPAAVLEELKMPRTPDLVKAFALAPPGMAGDPPDYRAD